jgi:hypothetical protein
MAGCRKCEKRKFRKSESTYGGAIHWKDPAGAAVLRSDYKTLHMTNKYGPQKYFTSPYLNQLH